MKKQVDANGTHWRHHATPRATSHTRQGCPSTRVGTVRLGRSSILNLRSRPIQPSPLQGRMETPRRIGENQWIDPGSNTDPTIPIGMAALTHEKRPAKTNIPITASVAPSIHRASILARAMHGRWHGFTARVEASARTFGSFATLLEPRALACGRGNVVMH